MKTSTFFKLLAGVVVVVAIVGGYMYPKTTMLAGASSSSGAYFNSVDSVTTVFAPLTSTSTSILNTGASDRAVSSSNIYCTPVGLVQTYATGATLASWTVTVATTSVANTGLQGNANYVALDTIGTSTQSGIIAGWVASSTVNGNFAFNVWPVNTYLTLNFNATSTATCSLKIVYVNL